MTPGGFYAWLGRAENAHATQDRVLTREITRRFHQHKARYGSPRIYQLLTDAGWAVSRRRIARLMRAAGLRAKAVQGYRAKAKMHQRYARHPNRLWETTVTAPTQVWVGDITFLKVGTTWRYLAIVMDQHSRRTLGWTLTARGTAAVTCGVLTRAARGRPTAGVIFHSDRGSEYMGAVFCAHVAQFGMLQGANVSGPGDNAHAESFVHSLKAELTRGVTFRTASDLRRELARYLRYYNTIRLHSGLSYRSPLACERQAA